MTAIPCFRIQGPRAIPPGHRAYSGPVPMHVTNRMAEARAQYHAAKALTEAAALVDARRALWSDCERRPVAMDGVCG